MEERKRIKSYVLRASRMSKGQKKAFDTLSGKYCFEYKNDLISIDDNPTSKPLCVEIGFGMGTATAEIAHKNPDTDFIGIEVHKPGVGRLLMYIEELSLENLKIINHDAYEVLTDMLPDASIDGFHIFFPDPWPKKKHHKRRLINDNFVELLVKKLKTGGYIYSATDWENYAEQMLDVFSRNNSIENQYEKWADSPMQRPSTSFEKKGISKNHVIRELFFKKN